MDGAGHASNDIDAHSIDQIMDDVGRKAIEASRLLAVASPEQKKQCAESGRESLA